MVLMFGACLTICLPLHMGISIPSATAYAATLPLGSSQSDVSLGFHDTYRLGSSNCIHSGVDIAGKAGDAVRAPLDSVVSFVGSVPSGDVLTGTAKQRTMTAVSLKLPDGKVVTLMPFESVAVSDGDAVKEGMDVGTLASHGDKSSKSTHLHMGLREGKTYLDPMSLFGGLSGVDTAGKASESVLLKAGQTPEMLLEPEGSAGQGADAAPLPSASAEQAIPVEDAVENRAEPGAESFGTITSQTAEVALANEQRGLNSEFGVSVALGRLFDALSLQTGELASGFQTFCDKLNVKYQIAIATSVLLVLLVATAIIGQAARFIRRGGASQKDRKTSLCTCGGGDSI